VAVIAPASPFTRDDFDRGIAEVTALGFEPVYDDRVFARRAFVAGEPDARAAAFLEAWHDPLIAGIFCVRGGYGSVRILDGLDVRAMRAATAKPVYGSSDVTAVHEWVREQLGAAGWFTPMIATDSLLLDRLAAEQLRLAVLQEPSGRRWSSDRAETLVPGTARGTTIGGNLSLLAMTLGARTRPPLDNYGADGGGTIALLEDVNEETYKVDGYLQSLLRAGWFDGVAGVALGSWQDCATAEGIRELFLETLAPLGIPVAWELGFGHCAGAHSVPLGTPCVLLAEAGRPPELMIAPAGASSCLQ
jgi:muramoyltetrapeptide carboxypeptidase